jgi:predicted house-cleaning noncanonical NTP pyrophosphatase (MazG superfamily)
LPRRPSRLRLLLEARGPEAGPGLGLCWRLVRDGLGEVLGSRGVRLSRARGEALERLARLKVVEEAVELLASGSAEEAGDVLEALRAWAAAAGVGWGEVEAAAAAKRRARGGFESGLAALLPCRAALLLLGLPGGDLTPSRPRSRVGGGLGVLHGCR